MNTHSIKSILVIALFLSITLAACLPGEEDIFWQQVSPPPGYDGSCYAYFKTEGYADLKHGFSGTWCY
jgi:hypothetical protein